MRETQSLPPPGLLIEAPPNSIDRVFIYRACVVYGFYGCKINLVQSVSACFVPPPNLRPLAELAEINVEKLLPEQIQLLILLYFRNHCANPTSGHVYICRLQALPIAEVTIMFALLILLRKVRRISHRWIANKRRFFFEDQYYLKKQAFYLPFEVECPTRKAMGFASSNFNGSKCSYFLQHC